MSGSSINKRGAVFPSTSQDTRYAQNNKQYSIESVISTVRLILFLEMLFQNCNIYVRYHGGNVMTITAQGREKDVVERNQSQSSRIGRRAADCVGDCRLPLRLPCHLRL